MPEALLHTDRLRLTVRETQPDPNPMQLSYIGLVREAIAGAYTNAEELIRGSMVALISHGY